MRVRRDGRSICVFPDTFLRVPDFLGPTITRPTRAVPCQVGDPKYFAMILFVWIVRHSTFLWQPHTPPAVVIFLLMSVQRVQLDITFLETVPDFPLIWFVLMLFLELFANRWKKDERSAEG